MKTTVSFAGLLLLGCTQGRGEGQVESADLRVPGCVDGAYEMDPNYFGASPFEDSQTIRVQRGNSPTINADALVVVVHDVEAIRRSLGSPTLVGIPPESYPEDVAIPFVPAPLVTMSLHLGKTCAEDVISLSALSGTVTFSALYSGEPNEQKVDRLIVADFDVMMGDPRDIEPDESAETGFSAPQASRVTGTFEFYYKKGRPAETFL